MPRQFYPLRFDHPSSIYCPLQIKKTLVTKFPALSVTSSPLDPNLLLSTPTSKTLNIQDPEFEASIILIQKHNT